MGNAQWQENIATIASQGGTSGQQYTDGASAPAHPIGTEIVFNNAGTMAAVSAAVPLPITGSISATNPSVGTSGSALPTSSTLIGGSDGTNLQDLLVESASHPNVRSAIYNGANELAVDSSGRLTLIPTQTVTANAGTNTSTASLALETGGNLATIAGAVSSSKVQANTAAIASALTQANQIPVSTAAAQGKLTLTVTSNTGTFAANLDNTITFSGGATVARRIRIQNESAGTIYWETDNTASTGSPSLVAPAANAVSVEWIAIQCTTLHIWVPSGGTTVLNGTTGVKVTAYA